MAYNLPSTVAKYAEVGRLMGARGTFASAEAEARAAVEAVRALLSRIGIPEHLRGFGVTPDRFDQIIAESLPSGSLKHNPRPLAAADVRAILEAAL